MSTRALQKAPDPATGEDRGLDVQGEQPPMVAVPGSSDLRRTARLEAADYLAALNLPEPGQSLLPWTQALANAETTAQFHVVTDTVIGSEGGALLALRDFLRAAGAWCDGHGQRALGDRYRRTSELLDVADRLAFQLGVDQLAAAHAGPAPA